MQFVVEEGGRAESWCLLFFGLLLLVFLFLFVEMVGATDGCFEGTHTHARARTHAQHFFSFRR